MSQLQVLALGAGVQSTTVYLMSVAGELPRIDHAVFADTGWEPPEVYEHLAKLVAVGETSGMPIHVVKRGGQNIREQHVGGGRTTIPFFVDSGGATEGKVRRSCTQEFKIDPITKKLRELIGVGPGHRAPKVPTVEQWFGISLDEVSRMRDSRDRWITNYYPLVERRMTRWDCERWLAGHGWSAVKSACIGCPFHDNRAWRAMKDQSPGQFADAVEFDKAVRLATNTIRGVPFLHRSLLPLDEVDLSTPEDHGQQRLFENECEGMCGV